MIGKIMNQIRIQQGIRQSDLCQGLCSVSTLSRYENGERKPDWLLAYTLLQRLGKSGECFTIALDLRGYDYLKWRMKIMECLESMEMEKVERLLKREPHYDEKNTLRKQFRLTIEALCYYKKTKDHMQSLEMLKEALCCTDATERKKGERLQLQSVWELNLRIVMIKIEYEWRKQERKLGHQDMQRMILELEEIIRFFEEKYTNIKEKAKIYPNAALVCMDLYVENGQYEKAVFHVQRALDLQQKAGSTKGVLRLLEGMEMGCRLQNDIRKAKKVRRQKEVLQGLSKRYHKKTEWLIYPENQIEVHLSNESLIRERKKQQISRDQLCGRMDLCSAITMARMERGRNFSRRKYARMAKELGAWVEPFHCDVAVQNYKTLELCERLKEELHYGTQKKLQEYFLRLEAQLDQTVPQNRQYIDFIRVMIKYRNTEVSEQEAGQALVSILSYTIPEILQKGVQAAWNKTLCRQEMEILVMLAKIWREGKKVERAAEILQTLLCYLSESRVDLRFHREILSHILHQLTQCYQMLGKEAEREACGQAAVAFCVRCGIAFKEVYMLEHIVAEPGQKLNRQEKRVLYDFSKKI